MSLENVVDEGEGLTMFVIVGFAAFILYKAYQGGSKIFGAVSSTVGAGADLAASTAKQIGATASTVGGVISNPVQAVQQFNASQSTNPVDYSGLSGRPSSAYDPYGTVPTTSAELNFGIEGESW